jgi:hypothetical protein
VNRWRAWTFLDDMVIIHCAGTKFLSSGYTSLHVRASLRDAVYYMLHLGKFRLSLTLRSGEASVSPPAM